MPADHSLGLPTLAAMSAETPLPQGNDGLGRAP
jgi:hypothetical protein